MKKPRKEFADFVNKCFGLEGFDRVLNEAAQRDTYVETLSVKADSLHLKVKRLYDDSLTSLYGGFVRPLILKERLGVVDLVADVTDENFYGNIEGLTLHPWTGEDGVKAHFKFLVVSILFRNKMIPFFAAILRVGYSKAEILGQAVKYCQNLRLKVRVLLLDRGFYSGDLIDTLNPNVKYLIFVPKKPVFQQMLEATEQSVAIEHEMTVNKNFSKYKVKTAIVLVKEVMHHDWIFATNLHIKNLERYVHVYRARWNIETMFRVHDEARIKSKSKIPQIRLFYFIISLLLLLLWNIHAKQVSTFKLFIITLLNEESEVGNNARK